MNHSLSFFATCSSGFEQTLYEELTELYATYHIPANVDIGSAGCYVSGPIECGILANLTSFCASKILLVILECEVETEQELYQNVYKINWPTFFSVDKTFCVKSTVSQSFIQNSMYLSLKVKDAICDSFMNKLTQRPNIEIKNSDIKVYVRLVKNRLSVSLDTTGDPLFMRGYKKNSLEAPLKETLAASLLRLSGWNKLAQSIFISSEPVYFERATSTEIEQTEKRKIPIQVLLSPFFVDQFCGSGTIVIEAALALLHFNPNCLREHFAFMNLLPEKGQKLNEKYLELKEKVLAKKKNIIEVKKAVKLYAEYNNIQIAVASSILTEGDKEKFKPAQSVTTDNFFPLRGNDIDEKAVTLSKEFAKKAGVDELINFTCGPAKSTFPHASCGLILINPPYGERIGTELNLLSLYKNIGDTWKKQFPNWTAWLLSSNESLTKSIGLRSTRKFSVYNGNLECRFLQYVMYAKG